MKHCYDNTLHIYLILTLNCKVKVFIQKRANIHNVCDIKYFLVAIDTRHKFEIINNSRFINMQNNVVSDNE